MFDSASATTRTKEKQYRLMDDFVKPDAEPLTPLERLIARVQVCLPPLRRPDTRYFVSVLLSVLIVYGLNFTFFFWFSPRIYGEEITRELSSLFFNRIFLLANSTAVLFSAWFVRYQSRQYVKALRDIRHLLDFPEKERDLAPVDKVTFAGILLRALWDPLYKFSCRFNRMSTILVGLIVAFIPLWVTWRFPVSEAYQHVGLYLVVFIVGSWAIAPVTWNVPEEYKGTNRNLWTAFRSRQALLATVFTLSIATAELTWVTTLPTMGARQFFERIHFLPNFVLRLEAYAAYLFLFVFLASLAHVICSVAVGIFFLWHRRYVIWLDPLDEFGSGGLRPLGVLVEKSTYAIAFVVAILLGSWLVVHPLQELRKPYYVQLVTGATFLIMFSYVLPVLVLHFQVKEFKLDWIRNLGPRKISILQEKLATWDASAEFLGSNWAAGYARIREISDWPSSNLSVIARVLLASLTPLITYFARLYLHISI